MKPLTNVDLKTISFIVIVLLFILARSITNGNQNFAFFVIYVFIFSKGLL